MGKDKRLSNLFTTLRSTLPKVKSKIPTSVPTDMLLRVVTEFVVSQNHPDLSDAKSPQTKKAILANKRKSLGARAVPACKRKLNRLNNQEMAMFVRSKNIKTYTELLALAEERRTEGLTDLSDYVFNHPERVIRELIVLENG